MRTKFLLVVLLGVTTFPVLACGGRLHMASTYARSYRTVFARQVVNPEGSTKTAALRGLDAQEAAMVVEGYRKGLSPTKESSAAERPLIFMAPQGPAGAYTPAPSVPGGH